MAAKRSFLIVGGGIAGLSTAYHLARAGGAVHLVEAEARFGTRATGLNAAILRTVIDEPSTAALGRRSKRAILAPPAGFSPTPLLVQRGLVLMADQPAAAAALERLCTALDSGVERIGARELAELAPHVATRPLVAFHAPDDGVLDVGAMVDGFARGARAAGATLETGRRVEQLLVEGDAVVGAVLDDGRRLRADAVLLAAGAWAAELAARAGSRVRMRPTRRHLMVTEPDAAVDPDWPVVWNGGDTFYSRPEAGGLMLSACDEVDAEPDQRDAVPAIADSIRAAAGRHLRGIGPLRPARFWLGLRTLTADERFAIGPDPHVRGLRWVAGLGGHGMTTAFEVGRLAALDALGQAGDEPLLAELDPARLAR